eukprot:GDKI01017298.1.p1 GENE.GDKI01017298.1~~GDKI01017298.1.p1  ORF type:complete len:106 (+),score=27.14 GDKI01017298.1:280-597(+)
MYATHDKDGNRKNNHLTKKCWMGVCVCECMFECESECAFNNTHMCLCMCVRHACSHVNGSMVCVVSRAHAFFGVFVVRANCFTCVGACVCVDMQYNWSLCLKTLQ